MISCLFCRFFFSSPLACPTFLSLLRSHLSLVLQLMSLSSAFLASLLPFLPFYASFLIFSPLLLVLVLFLSFQLSFSYFLLNEISPKLLSIVFFLSFPSLIMYAFISPIVSLFCPVSLTSFNVENWKKKGKKMRISLLLLLCPSFNVLLSFFLSFSLCFSLF